MGVLIVNVEACGVNECGTDSSVLGLGPAHLRRVTSSESRLSKTANDAFHLAAAHALL